MKIARATILSLLLFVFASSNAQEQPPKLAGKELFGKMDKDKNSEISLSEMKSYYEGYVNWEGKPIPSAYRFLAYDRDENDIVTLDEIELGLDWDAYNKRRKKKSAPVSKKVSPIINIDDSLLTLEEALNATSSDDDDEHIDLDKETSLDDFKSEFINGKE